MLTTRTVLMQGLISCHSMLREEKSEGLAVNGGQTQCIDGHLLSSGALLDGPWTYLHISTSVL